MNTLLKLCIGLCLIFSLTGCIGEEYDFTPPTVTISTVLESENTQSIILQEANINWNSDKQYKKETKDILSLAKGQQPVPFKSGQKVYYSFDSQDFAVNEVKVSVWHNDQEIELQLNDDGTFVLPTEQGEYVIVFDLRTDSGSAQFVGNLLMVGSSHEQTFENFIYEKMAEMHSDEIEYMYGLVHKEFNVVHENDAIAVFREESNGEEKIFIAYVEKVDNEWQWIRTTGAQWNSRVNWSSTPQPPYIYLGAISDNTISEVFAGDEPAIIIQVEDEKRFWYAISPSNNVEITVMKENGSKEILEEISEDES